MMRRSSPATLRYARGADYQAVELPYQGQRVAMLIIMPDDLASFEAALSPDYLAEIIGRLTPQSVEVTLPRFTTESDWDLKTALITLGMTDAFDAAAADFSGMDGRRDLFITDAFHRAYVAVDEQGTTAAAATAIVVGLTSMPVAEVELTLDHPFIYLIREVDSGAVLFIGRLAVPEQ